MPWHDQTAKEPYLLRKYGACFTTTCCKINSLVSFCLNANQNLIIQTSHATNQLAESQVSQAHNLKNLMFILITVFVNLGLFQHFETVTNIRTLACIISSTIIGREQVGQ